MGLYVSVYKDIKAADSETEGDSFVAYVIDDCWKHKIKNLIDGQLYEGRVTDSYVSYSYSTHSRFREFLIKVIGKDEELLNDHGRIRWDDLSTKSDIPFYDLIWFADNEGCLDWEVSEKLFKEFEENFQAALQMESKYKYMVEKYLDWYNIFKDAKNKGVVVFS